MTHDWSLRDLYWLVTRLTHALSTIQAISIQLFAVQLFSCPAISLQLLARSIQHSARLKHGVICAFAYLCEIKIYIVQLENHLCEMAVASSNSTICTRVANFRIVFEWEQLLKGSQSTLHRFMIISVRTCHWLPIVIAHTDHRCWWPILMSHIEDPHWWPTLMTYIADPYWWPTQMTHTDDHISTDETHLNRNYVYHSQDISCLTQMWNSLQLWYDFHIALPLILLGMDPCQKTGIH